jgi:hypothetical protein
MHGFELHDAMTLRLVYFGPIRPHGRGKNIASHVHFIRRQFHRQLREFWRRSEALNHCLLTIDEFNNGVMRPLDATRPNWMSSPPLDIDGGGAVSQVRMPLLDAVLARHSANCMNSKGYRWVPLTLSQYSVSCEIDMLMLFTSPEQAGPKNFGDLDNRVKTVIDALKQPDPDSISHCPAPGKGDDPFFVLYNDDKVVSKLTVETDNLYRPRMTHHQEKPILLTVNVTLRPYNVNMFNLMFA